MDELGRRAFLVTTAGLAVAGLGRRGVEGRQRAGSGNPEEALVADLVRLNDDRLPGLLERQERGASHRWAGGVANEFGIFTAGDTAGLVSALACAVAAEGSRGYRDADLLGRLQQAARFLLKVQHDDGTIDLYSTNFHSPPDTAFVLERLCPACAILERRGWPPLAPVVADLRRFIVRAAEALTTGGVHTPNHRWVVCAALAQAHALAPDPRYVSRIDAWLAETIDIDPDGQYTERSSTVYSPVVNRALLTVARLLDRPALREPVRRNLDMTLYFVHPDGEVVTEASRRQDRYQRGTLARYYYAYRTMARLDGDGRFAAVARRLEREERPALVGDLPAFLDEPAFSQPLPPDAAVPADYARVFAHSSLARIRRGALSATIVADNASWFSLRKGAAALEAVRLASAFFGKGQFTGARLEVSGGRYTLRQTLDGPYFQPFTADQIAGGVVPTLTPNGTLAADSRAIRGRSNVQTLDTVAIVEEAGGGFTLSLSVDGTAEVPVALELAFRRGGRLDGVEPVAGIPDAFLLRGDAGRYTFDGQTITFGPGRVEHTWTQLRGALPKWDGLSVYLTGFTPFRTQLRIG
jgi:hypothetical protein